MWNTLIKLLVSFLTVTQILVQAKPKQYNKNPKSRSFDKASLPGSPTVDVEGLGKITGRVGTSRENDPYFSFYGIPYGTVSTRFKAAKKYTGKFQSKKSLDEPVEPCAQNALTKMIGEEDCLTLDVHTPDVKKQYPVIVYFAPGGFQSREKSTLREPMFFMDNNVVLVQISSRLGVLGYLSTGDGEVQGNMGLKDQVLALEWIQTHIASFGGNPSSVTLLGVSSGAATAIYHMLSHSSVGLFHRVIAISGAPLNPWALQHRQSALFQDFVSQTNCHERKSTEDRVSCLQELPYESLLEAQKGLAKLTPEFDMMNMRFVPCIEIPNREKPFLDKHPRFLMQTGQIASKVPLLTGFTQDEGSFYTAMLSIRPESVERLDREWDHIAPIIFYFDEYNMEKAGQIAIPVKLTYYPNGKITPNNLKPLTNLFSERYITNGVTETILLLRDHVSVYTYIFKHRGKKSITQFYFKGVTEAAGVAHLDELLYLFNDTVGASENTLGGSEYRDFSEKYVGWISTFATSGTVLDEFGASSSGMSSSSSVKKSWAPSKKGEQVTFNEINYSSGKYVDADYSSNNKRQEGAPPGQVLHPNIQHANFWTSIRKNEGPIAPLSNNKGSGQSRIGTLENGGGGEEPGGDWTTLEPYQYGRLNEYYDCIRFDRRDVNVCVKFFDAFKGSAPKNLSDIIDSEITEEPNNTDFPPLE